MDLLDTACLSNHRRLWNTPLNKEPREKRGTKATIPPTPPLPPFLSRPSVLVSPFPVPTVRHQGLMVVSATIHTAIDCLCAHQLTDKTAYRGARALATQPVSCGFPHTPLVRSPCRPRHHSNLRRETQQRPQIVGQAPWYYNACSKDVSLVACILNMNKCGVHDK